MKRIGDSCDWSRERFTLNPDLSRAVLEAFVRLYERGLIYRGTYMVNWCPRCATALSDLEVKHEDTQGNLWHIRYPVNGSSRYLDRGDHASRDDARRYGSGGESQRSALSGSRADKPSRCR